MQKRIFILDGGSDLTSFSSAIADSYRKGAIENDWEVRLIRVRDLCFDPVLHFGYKEVQELEPDLKKQQENLVWCNHFVLVFPVWWMQFPAKLKGFFDRAFLPGFAFKYKKGRLFPEKYMIDKSARIIYTQGSPKWLTRWFFQDSIYRNLKYGILKFSGFSSVKRIYMGKINSSNLEERRKWLEKVYKLGRKGE
jgi:putative NADPH-quinone reductase